MAAVVIKEIFPNPTVKQVLFEIRFPNLFYIESKIGELQLKVMTKFPESSLIFQKQFFITSKEREGTIDSPEFDRKIWEFRSANKFRFSVSSNSLSILSEFHKTYNLGAGEKFRDVISFVTGNFFDAIPIPIINRVGLRYIDECPIVSKRNRTFKSYYNSAFPIERFKIQDAEEMTFRTVVKREDLNLIYMEELKKLEKKFVLVLSFDAFATGAQRNDCMEITDKLHTLISDEYERTIKEPVYRYMRGQ